MRIKCALGNEILYRNRIKFQNLTSNFNYRHVFDTAGRELTADLDYIVYDNVSDMVLTTDFFDGMGQPGGEQLVLKGHFPFKYQYLFGKVGLCSSL